MAIASETPSTAQQTHPSPPIDHYRDLFLAILNNRDKQRRNGFVILARHGSDMAPLQDLCNKKQQQWNTCLTARYRLQPGAIFGTLLAAFLTDLQEVQRGGTNLVGYFSPAVTDAAWQKFLEQKSTYPYNTDLPANVDQLAPELLGNLLDFLSSDTTLGTGERLVLFAEIEGTDEVEATSDKPEWEIAAKILFNRLPERVGLVFSGAPKDFYLEDSPNFLELTLPESTSPGLLLPGQLRFKQSSFLSDLATEKDVLGIATYAEALARFVLHPQTEPPLTIGIHGPWGQGKSSFMKLVNNALIEQTLASVDSSTQSMRSLIQLKGEIAGIEEKLNHVPEEVIQRRNQYNKKGNKYQKLRKKLAEPHVLTVDFNAWQYEDATQTWAGLASVITERLERALPLWRRGWMRLRYAQKKRLSELLLYVAPPLLFGLVMLGYLVFGDPKQFEAMLKNAAAGDLVLHDLLTVLLPLGSSLSLIWFASKQILSIVQPLSERVLSYIQLPTYSEQMGYQHRVIDDLRFVYSFLPQQGLNSKVVVFIDDLDRCSEETIMEVLQAIILILGDSKFFVFLGMETEMIYRAIYAYYTKQQNGVVLPADFPEKYLRKIVQIPFRLPNASKDSRLAYLKSLFSGTAQTTNEKPLGDSILTDRQEARVDSIIDSSLPVNFDRLQKPSPLLVVDTIDELEAFRENLKFLQDNPREVKRLINLHRLIKIILQEQHHDLSQKKDQRKLVRWLIFCATWPDLIDRCGRIAEIPQLSESADILAELIKQQKRADALPLLQSNTDPPWLKELEEFAGTRNPDDRLSTKDILRFIGATQLSTVVRDSVARPDK